MTKATDCKCVRCGYTWVTIKETRPKVCPRCKSYHWDEPKKGGLK